MILNIRLEVEVTNSALLDQTVRDLHSQGAAGAYALNNPAEAACEVINAGIPLKDAGLELVHWDGEEAPEDGGGDVEDWSADPTNPRNQ